jgi:hypothetical protein
MTQDRAQLPPTDVCLLLRAHAEQRWLGREVEPLLDELQRGRPLPAHERMAAIAYLEVVWMEACRRALQSDGALAALPPSPAHARAAEASARRLESQARRYHDAVRRLRLSLVERVATLIATADGGFTGEPVADPRSLQDARHEADCIRSGRWRPGLTYSRIRRTPTAP